MGHATIYCEKCGEMIPETDFESGRAVWIQNKHYCARCKSSVAHLLPPPEPSPTGKRRSSSGMLPAVRPAAVSKPPSSGMIRAVRLPGHEAGPGSYAGPAPATAPGEALPGFPVAPHNAPAGGRGGRTARVAGQGTDRRRTTPRGPASMGILIGVLFAAVLIVAVLLRVSDQNTRAVREHDADLAWQAILDRSRAFPDDADETMAMLIAKKPLFAGTPHEREIDPLIADLRHAAEAAKRRKDLRDRLAAIRNDRHPADITGPRRALDLLERESEGMPDDFRRGIRTERDRLELVEREAKLDEAIAFDRANLREYAAAVDRYSAIYMECEAEPYAELRKKAREGRDAVVARRDADAQTSYEEIESRVRTLLPDRRFDEAAKACDAFDAVRFGSAPSARRLIELKAEIADARSRAGSSGAPGSTDNPGGSTSPPAPATDPGVAAPPGQATVLFDANTPGAWEVHGKEIEVKVESGVLVGRHLSADPPPESGKRGSVSEFFNPRTAPLENYEMNLEVQLVRGVTYLMVQYHDGAVGVVFSLDSAHVTLGEWTPVRIRLEDRALTYTLGGRRVGQLTFDARAPREGTVAFGVFSGTEFRIRKATVFRLK